MGGYQIARKETNMSNIIINSKRNTIEITKAFEKAASRFGTEEYNNLRQARNDNPNYKVVVIKRKNNTDSFKGLTYNYMEEYIKSHDDENGTIMAKYKDLLGTSEEAIAACVEPCSYGKMKSWFLNTYPAVKEFHERRASSTSKVA